MPRLARIRRSIIRSQQTARGVHETRLVLGALGAPSLGRLRVAKLEDGIRSAPWEVDSSFDFRSTLHVNIQAARAVKRVLKERCAEGLVSERLVNGTDSRVVLGAWANGRSFSTRLNGVLRASLGWSVLGYKRLVEFWLESEENPSDDPSRFKPRRKPRAPTPETEALIRPERILRRDRIRGVGGEDQLVLGVFAGCGGLRQRL